MSHFKQEKILNRIQVFDLGFVWRRERDLNPRYTYRCTHDFQSCSFGHSDISPFFSSFIRASVFPRRLAIISYFLFFCKNLAALIYNFSFFIVLFSSFLALAFSPLYFYIFRLYLSFKISCFFIDFYVKINIKYYQAYKGVFIWNG